MALGDLTKQLATEALKAPVKDVLDALRPPGAAQVAESAKAAARPPVAPGENVCSIMLGQIQAMQRALKEDEELVVLFSNSMETIRVMEIYVPAWTVAVLTGIDTERNLTRVITAADAMQLVCKVMKAPAGAKPVRVGLVAPKP